MKMRSDSFITLSISYLKLFW